MNGFAIAWFRISPFVVTLGMMSVARGLALIITNGQPVFGMPSSFKYLGTAYIGPVPVPVIVAAFVVLFAHILLTRTCFSRYIYAIGGNEEAARLSGINVLKYKLLAYTLCGLLTGLAAVVLSSRVNSGEPNLLLVLGNQYLLSKHSKAPQCLLKLGKNLLQGYNQLRG